MVTLQAFVRSACQKMLRKVTILPQMSPKKSTKTLHGNAVRRASQQPVSKHEQNGTHPAEPGGARRSLGNGGRGVEMEPNQQRVMARIMAVKQTPSNKPATRRWRATLTHDSRHLSCHPSLQIQCPQLGIEGENFSPGAPAGPCFGQVGTGGKYHQN